MRVALGFATHKKLKTETNEILLALDDQPERLVCPIQVWEGSPEELRKRLHQEVDAAIDRSCFESDFKLV